MFPFLDVEAEPWTGFPESFCQEVEEEGLETISVYVLSCLAILSHYLEKSLIVYGRLYYVP